MNFLECLKQWFFADFPYYMKYGLNGVSDEAVVGGFILTLLVIIIAVIVVCCGVYHVIDTAVRGYKNIAKPALKKMKLGTLTFNVDKVYIPITTIPYRGATEEYDRVIEKVSKVKSKEYNRHIFDVLGNIASKYYMSKDIYPYLFAKKNLEGSHCLFAMIGGKLRTSEYLKMYEGYVTPMKHGPFKDFHILRNLLNNVAVMHLITMVEIGSSEGVSNDIIRDQHDMNIYMGRYNNIAMKLSTYIPVLAINLRLPNDSDKDKYYTQTSDGYWYRAFLNIHIIINGRVLCLQDDDTKSTYEELEALLAEFHIREMVEEMAGDDYMLQTKDITRKKKQEEDNSIKGTGFILFPTSMERLDKAFLASDRKTPFDVHLVETKEQAIMHAMNLNHGAVVIIKNDPYIIIRHSPLNTEKLEAKRALELMVTMDGKKNRVWRYDSLEEFTDHVNKGFIVANRFDILVIQKNLEACSVGPLDKLEGAINVDTDEYYLIS